MYKPRYSIIVPTLVDKPLLLDYLDVKELGKAGVEVIVVRDRWRNANRTRNIGAAVAKGEILCFIDDDSKIDQEKLIELLRAFEKYEKCFIWYDRPHLLIVRLEDFLDIKGYDERFKPNMAEDIELRHALLKRGLKEVTFDPLQISLTHLGSPKEDRQRYLLNQRHLTWLYWEYKVFPFWKLVLRKNIFEVLRRVFWILKWVFVERRRPRSIFCP